MADQLFFKKLNTTQWLGLRLPSGLAIEVHDDGSFSANSDWHFESPAQFPDNITNVMYVALEKSGENYQPALRTIKLQAPPTNPFLYTAFTDSLAALADGAPVEPETDASPRVQFQRAITETLKHPGLPLQLYSLYRKAPRGDIDDVKGYLLTLAGSTEKHLRLEALSQMLFIVTCAPGTSPQHLPLLNIFVDPTQLDAKWNEKITPLTISARQGPHGVVLEFTELDGRTLTNRSVLAAIFPQTVDGAAPPVERGFGCYYQWQRALGLTERSATQSGPILIPLPVDEKPAAEPTPIVDPRAAEPFRILDQLAPTELVGELLNYDVSFYNPHGSCTRRGRVMIKRLRLDRPPPPSQASVTLDSVSEDGIGCTCTVTFSLTKEHLDQGTTGSKLELVIYRHDFPIIPTGFYGDEDDQSLSVARRMSDLDTAFATQAEYGTRPTDDQQSSSGESNLSNHNLDYVMTKPFSIVPAQTTYPESVSLNFAKGTATRFFVALRRVPDESFRRALSGAPESSVVEAASQIGALADITDVEERTVPHFEAFWNGKDAPRTLVGAGLARVIELHKTPVPATSGADTATAATNQSTPEVCVVIQHRRPETAVPQWAIGGYRLWMRDRTAREEEKSFVPVALVQALPPLVKAYAPIELGRKWTRSDVAPLERVGPRLIKATLTSPDFIVLEARENSAFSAATESLKSASVQAAEVLKGASRETTTFSKTVADTEVAFKSAPVDIAKVILALKVSGDVPHKVNAGDEVLKAVLALRDAGQAQEVALSIRKRQQLQQGYMTVFPGHWLFFQDQNSQFLGRAIHFWARESDATVIADAETVNWHFALHETAGAYDAVGMDDFGRIAWRWDGIKDLWRHELEWMIETIPRYDPMFRKRATLDPIELPPVAPDATALHQLTIQRSAPLRTRFGMTQHFYRKGEPKYAEDAFHIRLYAPPEVRQTLHNAVARTRLGILRMVPLVTRRSLVDHSDFIIQRAATPDLDKVRRDLFESCLAGSPPEPVAVGLTLDGKNAPGERGEYGLLMIDEPACAEITVAVQSKADAVDGPLTSIGPLRRQAVKVDMPSDETPTLKNAGAGFRITIPLARLAWSYSGLRKPVIREYRGADGASADFIEQYGDREVLKLPDPSAELLLFFSIGNIFIPVLVFKGTNAELPDQTQFAGMENAPLAWGWTKKDNANITSIGFQGASLVILTATKPNAIRYQWRIQSQVKSGNIPVTA